MQAIWYYHMKMNNQYKNLYSIQRENADRLQVNSNMNGCNAQRVDICFKNDILFKKLK